MRPYQYRDKFLWRRIGKYIKMNVQNVHFTSPNEINKLAYYANVWFSVGNQTGGAGFGREEILRLIKTGSKNNMKYDNSSRSDVFEPRCWRVG